MPKRKKREKTLFPDEITETLPTDLVNLNRAKLTYKHGKTKITLLKSFRAESVPSLKQVHRLDSVTFQHGGIVNADVLNDLAPLDLRYLEIGKYNQCTNDDLACLGNWRELERLVLWCSTKITDAGLAHLRKLGLLTRLYIFCNHNITEKGLLPLTHLKHLEKLFIMFDTRCGNSRITGESWRGAGRPQKLRDLMLTGNWTDTGIAKLARWVVQLPQLENLTVQCLGDVRNHSFFVPVERVLGDSSETRTIQDVSYYHKKWIAIRSRREITEFMEWAQMPVSYMDLARWTSVSKYGGWYFNQALKILIERGVLVEIERGECEDQKYRLKDMKDPWDDVEREPEEVF